MNTPHHPGEYVHGGIRMVSVPVKIHWSYLGRNGVADYEAIAMVTEESNCFELSKFPWTEGNFGCDCNRSIACGLADDSEGTDKSFPCGQKIRITRLESMDPSIPSLELNEKPA